MSHLARQRIGLHHTCPNVTTGCILVAVPSSLSIIQPRIIERILIHYTDAITGAMASQITSLTIVYSTVYSGADKKHQSSGSLALVWERHRWPVNSPHKWPIKRKMYPFDDVIMHHEIISRKVGCGDLVEEYVPFQRVYHYVSVLLFEKYSKII